MLSLSCRLHAAAQFLKNAILSHAMTAKRPFSSHCSHTVVINCSVLADISAMMSCSSAWTAVNVHTHSRDIVHLGEVSLQTGIMHMNVS